MYATASVHVTMIFEDVHRQGAKLMQGKRVIHHSLVQLTAGVISVLSWVLERAEISVKHRSVAFPHTSLFHIFTRALPC